VEVGPTCANWLRDLAEVTGDLRHTFVVSRSMQLAAGVHVPKSDIANRNATSIHNMGGADARPLIHVHAAALLADAYNTAYYENHWFWIDNHDLRSKGDFMFLLSFYAPAGTRAISQAPIVSISDSGHDRPTWTWSIRIWTERFQSHSQTQ
jgi:hypothetical protein